jgi:hypothetical protein
MDASGRAIDEKYLRQQPLHESWWTLVFPQERPSPQDFRLWEEALVELTQQGGIWQRMGGISEKEHTIWKWQYDDGKEILYHTREGVTHI